MLEPSPRVLVAEKDIPVRQFIAHVLKAVGYSVTEVGSGPDALAALAHPLNTFDVVILHEGMDGKSGSAVLRDVRRWGVESPAVIISGAMTGDVHDLAAVDGRVRLLTKPLGTQELVRTLFDLLGSRPAG